MSGYDPSDSDPSQAAQRPIVRDKRRIDPETGELRQPPADVTDPLSPEWQPDGGQQWDGPESYESAYLGPADTRSANTGSANTGSANNEYPAYEPPAPPSYSEQAAAAYAEQGAAYASQVDPAWSYEEQPDVNSPAPGQASAPSGATADVHRELAERIADLQRLQAEYTNYRRRVERDRVSMQEQALVNVLTSLLPLLDDVARARDHGDLTGGFRAVGEALEAVVEKLGVARFGEPGEPFDPMVHEALTHTYSAEVTEPTAVAVLQPGFRIAERILRPARVAVAEPEA